MSILSKDQIKEIIQHYDLKKGEEVQPYVLRIFVFSY